MTEKTRTLRTMDEWERVEGAPWPLGASWVESERAYNFALYSRHAGSVTLLLYTEHDPANPVHLYVFDPVLNKSGLIWHCRVREEELRGATLYQEGRGEEWRRDVDTSLSSPEDIAETGKGYPVSSLQHVVKARSIVVLERQER